MKRGRSSHSWDALPAPLALLASSAPTPAASDADDLSDVALEEAADIEPEGEEASQNLRDMLLQLLYLHKLSARSVCTIAYWAEKAGAVGAVRALSFRPNAPSGHFQRHIDQVTGVNVKASASTKYR
eukprot:2166627-Alexandrium_andersonii.AAC.1